MTDWHHKTLLEKLDRMQAQRDRLRDAAKRVLACAETPIEADDLRAALADPEANEDVCQEAEAFLELLAALDDAEGR